MINIRLLTASFDNHCFREYLPKFYTNPKLSKDRPIG